MEMVGRLQSLQRHGPGPLRPARARNRILEQGGIDIHVERVTQPPFHIRQDKNSRTDCTSSKNTRPLLVTPLWYHARRTMGEQQANNTRTRGINIFPAYKQNTPKLGLLQKSAKPYQGGAGAGLILRAIQAGTRWSLCCKENSFFMFSA